MTTPWRRADTTWFKDCRWGMFTHYLADSASNLKPIDLSPDELTIGYTKFINSKGGVVSWDAPLTPPA